MRLEPMKPGVRIGLLLFALGGMPRLAQSQGDQSKVPDELKSALTTLCEAFKEMAVEEVEELLDL